MMTLPILSILSPLENILRNVLDWLHGSVGLPWAWAIVAVTVIVRLILVPLTVKQIHSMQNLQRHAPQMKEIQKKYKQDKKKQQEELMRFYRENQINPAASCLPLLAQVPVFIALSFVLRNFTSHVHATPHELSWLGLINITHHASTGWGPMLLVIYAGSQIASTFFMSATMDKTQRTLLLVLPLVFITFISRFPAGLVLYWVTTNLWTVGQGLVTRRLAPKPAVPPKRTSRTPAKQRADGDGDGSKPAQPAPKPTGQPRVVRRKKKRARR
jgi:YidC/Oxa1 family membrane protein insertase